MMGFISDVLEQINWGIQMSADMVKDNLHNTGLKPSAKIDLMERIADCYSKEEQPGDASKWFEMAAKAVLDSSDCP